VAPVSMTEQTNGIAFEEAVLPHLDAAYNLARWLTRNTQDAEDVVQEAYLRAFRFFSGFHGGNARAWLLKIVRNTCYTWLHQNRTHQATDLFDEQIHTDVAESRNPETLLLQRADGQLLNQALDELPTDFREVLVLLELEGLSYKEIAEVLGIPIGTVMSRLARARHRLRESLNRHLPNEKAAGDRSKNRARPRDPQAREELPPISGDLSESGELSETEFASQDSACRK
jgi:RNA polymerase sigma-70 factor (ECF subfamily)